MTAILGSRGLKRRVVALACATALLAGCGSFTSPEKPTAKPVAPIAAPKVAPPPPTAISQEQARISAAYGGPQNTSQHRPQRK
jgi:type IV pilus biogenesis protein CpaD/CtpE